MARGRAPETDFPATHSRTPTPTLTMKRPISRAPLKRWALVIPALLFALAIAGVGFMHFAAQSLKVKSQHLVLA